MGNRRTQTIKVLIPQSSNIKIEKKNTQVKIRHSYWLGAKRLWSIKCKSTMSGGHCCVMWHLYSYFFKVIVVRLLKHCFLSGLQQEPTAVFLFQPSVLLQPNTCKYINSMVKIIIHFYHIGIYCYSITMFTKWTKQYKQEYVGYSKCQSNSFQPLDKFNVPTIVCFVQSYCNMHVYCCNAFNSCNLKLRYDSVQAFTWGLLYTMTHKFNLWHYFTLFSFFPDTLYSPL